MIFFQHLLGYRLKIGVKLVIFLFRIKNNFDYYDFDFYEKLMKDIEEGIAEGNLDLLFSG